MRRARRKPWVRVHSHFIRTYSSGAERATDKGLMAHELTHTVQQRGAPRAKLVIGDGAASEEREADAVAGAVERGSAERVAISSNSVPAIRHAPAKDHTEAAAAAAQPLPTWTEPELKAIQGELIRLGLYRATADGDFGVGTQSDGCRSVGYEKQLRKTSGFDTKKADMLGSSVELNWGDEGKTLTAFLDSIIKMQSAEQITSNMDKQQSVGTGSYHAYGVSDNPILK
jgi:hypothetical protein